MKSTVLANTNKKYISKTLMILLLGELIRGLKGKVSSIKEFEKKLSAYGIPVGEKLLELYMYKEMKYKREAKVLQLLVLLKGNIWKYLFGYAADKLEQSRDDQNKYMITELSPITNIYTEVPTDFGQLSPAAWVAGIIEGIISAAGFPCNVSAHNASDAQHPTKTIYLITLESKEV